MKRRLEQEWARLRILAYPSAPARQLIELRRAFFAGAQSFFTIQLAAYDDSTADPTEEDLQIITDLNAEIEEFAAKVKAGVA